jgi:polyisoprenoid-binding protein YceI
MKAFLVIVALSFLSLGCSNSPKEHIASDNNKEKVSIHQKIKEDLTDGLSHPNTLIVDEPNLPKNKWVAERGHSSISFTSRHWEIVDLIGFFDDFEVSMYFEKADFSDAVIFAKANPYSIVMPNFKMAGALINEEYFHADKYPIIEFKSILFMPLHDSDYALTGLLKIKGIEKEIHLNAKFNGYAYPEEKRFAGFSAQGKFSRYDYNIGGKNTLHSGKLMHSDSISFIINLRMENIPR